MNNQNAKKFYKLEFKTRSLAHESR